MNSKEELELKALESLVISQLQIECLENLPENLNRRKIKKLSNELIKELLPLTKYYDKMYMQDEETGREIVWEYDNFIKNIAQKDLMKKVALSQVFEAFEIDSETMTANAHRVIKKNMRNGK